MESKGIERIIAIALSRTLTRINKKISPLAINGIYLKNHNNNCNYYYKRSKRELPTAKIKHEI